MATTTAEARARSPVSIEKARVSVQAGATGLIFGRNVWQRPFEEALAITERVEKEVLSQAGS